MIKYSDFGDFNNFGPSKQYFHSCSEMAAIRMLQLPIQFRENHTSVYGFSLARQAGISYLCSRKLTNQVITLKTNLDYETYIISNRSGIRDDDIRKCTETDQHLR